MKSIVVFLIIANLISCKARETNSNLAESSVGDEEISLQKIEERITKIENKVQEHNYTKMSTRQRIDFLKTQFKNYEDNINLIKMETVLELTQLEGLNETTKSHKLNTYLEAFYDTHIKTMNKKFLAESKSSSVAERKEKITLMLSGYENQFASLLGNSLLDRITKIFLLYPEINNDEVQKLSLLEKIALLEESFNITDPERSLLERLNKVEEANAQKMAALEKSSPFSFWEKRTLLSLQEVELKIYPEL